LPLQLVAVLCGVDGRVRIKGGGGSQWTNPAQARASGSPRPASLSTLLGQGVRKRFFLEKEAKTFAYWGKRWVQRVPKVSKVFWFFFSKKNCLPS
jgi:hypothetical protein